MMRSLFSAVSGLKNHQTAMDVIGNNISNVNTTAYKSSSVIFTDLYSQTISEATGASADTGGSNAQQVGLGVNVSGIRTSIGEGSTQNTGNTLDFAITGEGYFIIQASDGNTYYTRNGAFDLDDEGNLVTQSGDYIMGVMIEDADVGTLTLTDYDPATDTDDVMTNIVIDPTKFSSYSIDGNGVVSAVIASQTDASGATWTTLDIGTEVEIGRVVLATFVNSVGLEKEGDSLYSVSTNSGDAVLDYANEDASGTLNSGSLEMSNVDLATELTSMIIMQRGFQANSRVITTSDTMLEELVNLKRS